MLGLDSKLLSSDVCLKLFHCKTLKKNWQLRELSEHKADGWTGCGTSSAPASSEGVHLKARSTGLPVETAVLALCCEPENFYFRNCQTNSVNPLRLNILGKGDYVSTASQEEE